MRGREKSMPYCGKCGNKIEDGQNFCGRCGERVQKPTGEKAQKTEQGKDGKKTPKKAIVSIAIGAGIIVLAAVAVALLFGGKASGAPNNALYMKDGEVFFIDQKKSNSRQMTTDMGSYTPQVGSYYTGRAVVKSIYFSKNGKYVLTPDEMVSDEENYGFSLYYQDLTHPEKEKIQIGTSVCLYTVNDTETTVTYLSDASDQGASLYQYSIERNDSEQIADKDVVNFWVSNDGKRVLYQDCNNCLYLKEEGKDTILLSRSISSVERILNDVSTVYYLDSSSTLYRQTAGEGKVKIGSDVCMVVRAYETGELYYLKKAEDVPMSFFITDDMKELDATVSEPEAPQYPEAPEYPNPPAPSDYGTDEEYEAAKKAYMTDITAYETALGEYKAECDRLDSAYQEAYDAFLAKEARDELRAAIENEILPFSPEYGALYYYDGSAEKLINGYCSMDNMENWWLIQSLSDKPVILFVARDLSKIEKMPLSEFSLDTMYYDFNSRFYVPWFASETVNVAVGDSIGVVEFSGPSAEMYSGDPADKYYYYDEGYLSEEIMLGDTFFAYVSYAFDAETGDLERCDLYKVPYSEGKPGEPELYDSCENGMILILSADNDQLVYLMVKDTGIFEDEDDYDQISTGQGTLYEGELYINRKKVDENVLNYGVDSEYSNFSDANGMDLMLYCTDYVDGDDVETGTLKAYKNGEVITIAEKFPLFYNYIYTYEDLNWICVLTYENDTEQCPLIVFKDDKPVQIADDVQSFTVCPGGRILYLTEFDADTEKGTLKEWIDGETRTIDDGVSCLMAYSESASKNRGYFEAVGYKETNDDMLFENSEGSREYLNYLKYLYHNLWDERAGDYEE